MHEVDLHELERFVAENDDLLALEAQIGRFNIFDALQVARIEIRHSNFLSWLLSPGESHGQGDLFLKSFLMDLLRKARQQGIAPPVSPVELDGADLQGVEIRREWRNIDLLILCEEPSFVVAIENKIYSGEHSNQLQKCEDRISKDIPSKRSLFVFLTIEGDEPSDEDWVTYSYAELHQAFSRTLKANSGSIGGDVAVFLDHYLSLIGSRFMENVDIDRLCKQIYSNHRRALDLIWERVGSAASGLVGHIERWLKERPNVWTHLSTRSREIIFVPASWTNMLPPIGKKKGFEQNWITVQIRVGKTALRLFVVVRPTNDVEMRKRIIERMLQDKGEFGLKVFFKKKELIGENWTRILSDEICEVSDDEEPDAENIIERVEKRLSEFLKQTERLPAAIKLLCGPRV